MPEPLVRVRWVDSHCYELYQVAADELPCPTTITSVGFLVADEAQHLVLAREQVRDAWRAVVAIPKTAVVGMERLGAHPLADED